MKTTFKLLLISASFLSASAFGKCEWVREEAYPGDNPLARVGVLTTSADGQTIYTTETFSDSRVKTFIWKSTDGGLTWWSLKVVK